MPEAKQLFVALQALLLLGGLLLLWRFFFSPSARRAPAPAALPRWEAPATDLLLLLMSALLAYFVLGAVAGQAARNLGLDGDAAKVATGAAALIGMLAGAILAPIDRGRIAGALPAGRVLLSGAAAFAAGFPAVLAVSLFSDWLLPRLGLPDTRQDMIRLLVRAENRDLLAVMITLAVVVAPLAEELVFRAGIFRFARGRLPRWAALALPALLFAAMHLNAPSFLPLVALAVVFALAYERTGHIGTPIVAHALFNLNTIAGVLCGAAKVA